MILSKKNTIRKKWLSSRKVLFILIFPFLIDTLVACCGCDTTNNYNYSHCDLTLVNLDNSGQDTALATGSVYREVFGIRLQINRSERVCQVKGSPSFFLSSAYAMDCRDCNEGFYQFRDNIVDIRVKSYSAFDEIHPAGSDVSQYFRVFHNNRYFTLGEIWAVNSRYGDDQEELLTLDMFLMTPPENSGEYTFQVELNLTDERSFVVDTETIILN